MIRSLTNLALGTALSAIAATPVAQQAGTPAPAAPPHRIVVIDAGHGGLQPGMTRRLPGGVTMPEKNINLGIALKLADALRKRGVEVVMTRTTDKTVGLEERGQIANAAKGDIKLFVSIHVNAPGDNEPHYSAERGFETYFLDEAKTEDERRVAAMENVDVQFESSAKAGGNNPLSFIITDMAQNEHLRESLDFATTIQDAVSTHPGPRPRRQAGESRGAPLSRSCRRCWSKRDSAPTSTKRTGSRANPGSGRWPTRSRTPRWTISRTTSAA